MSNKSMEHYLVSAAGTRRLMRDVGWRGRINMDVNEEKPWLMELEELSTHPLFRTQRDKRRWEDDLTLRDIGSVVVGIQSIERNVAALAEAPSFGRDVFGYTSWATGAVAYREVTAEILKRIEK